MGYLGIIVENTVRIEIGALIAEKAKWSARSRLWWQINFAY